MSNQEKENTFNAKVYPYFDWWCILLLVCVCRIWILFWYQVKEKVVCFREWESKNGGSGYSFYNSTKWQTIFFVLEFSVTAKWKNITWLWKGRAQSSTVTTVNKVSVENILLIDKHSFQASWKNKQKLNLAFYAKTQNILFSIVKLL